MGFELKDFMNFADEVFAETVKRNEEMRDRIVQWHKEHCDTSDDTKCEEDFVNVFLKVLAFKTEHFLDDKDSKCTIVVSPKPPFDLLVVPDPS